VLGVDIVSLIIFVAAYAFTRIRSIPLRWRDLVFGLALGGIGVYRFNAQTGDAAFNRAIALVALVIAVFYVVKAMRGQRRR